MEALLVSAGIVALAEIGDKTQLLTLLLAARYKRPWPIVAGILVATLVNHGIAGAVGSWLTQGIGTAAMSSILGVSFFAMAAWMLIPDQLAEDADISRQAGNVVTMTICLFFFAEMGDKTQIATVALAARFDSLGVVVVGSTAGMMLVNAPVAFCGDALARRLPVRAVRLVAALAFVALGVGVLLVA